MGGVGGKLCEFSAPTEGKFCQHRVRLVGRGLRDRRMVGLTKFEQVPAGSGGSVLRESMKVMFRATSTMKNGCEICQHIL